MCGIIACMGENIEERLLEGLERLEYRGYDSAGMTLYSQGEFKTFKTLGSTKQLKKLISSSHSGFGIAHTRWATHGNISIENTHPHFSQGGGVALVHNGIIENYNSIKEELSKQGFSFVGGTDSEVVAKFLGDSIDEKILGEKLKFLKGSYAFALLCKGQKRIYFAKNKSPLYLCERGIIASDPSCFVGYGEDFITLEDGEYGYIDEMGAKVFKHGKRVFKSSQKINFEFALSDMQDYEHYMIKEIYDTQKVLAGIKNHFTQESTKALVKKLNFNKFTHVYFIGCGTAYHAGLMACEYFKRHFKGEFWTEKAGEMSYKNLPIDDKTLCFFISQSGETADTLSALEYVKSRGGECVGIVNTIYSTLSQKCDYVFPICAGQERAVASTKAYFGQVLTLMVIGKILLDEDIKLQLEKFEKELDFGDESQIQEVAKYLRDREKLFFIGRGDDYISAQEGSLKMKEISYIFSCAESSAELKHGSLALIEKGVDGVLIATHKSTLSKNLANAEEIWARGGKIIFVSPFDVQGKMDYIIKVKPCMKDFLPLQTMIVLQKLAYYTAVLRGNNPDKPRNLAKSVTVE